MNDIKLEANGDGTFDWGFTHDDVQDVTGVQQTISSVIHAVMLHYNELIPDCYSGKGCEAHDYVKTKQSDKITQVVQDSIIQACTQVEGIRSATVSEVTQNNNTYTIKISVIRDDGQEVVIGGL